MITTEQLDVWEDSARRALQHPEACSPGFLTLTRDVVLPLAAEVRRLQLETEDLRCNAIFHSGGEELFLPECAIMQLFADETARFGIDGRVEVSYSDLSDGYIEANWHTIMSTEQLRELYRCWRQNPRWGIEQWIFPQVLGRRPLVRTEQMMRDNGAWNETLEALPLKVAL